MGYQALLFCPDGKLARVISQVFSELDFTIEPVQEPFAAVKKLMAQRYDAIVVDCENEQNASLLFKSARNSSSNQNSLALALVEGQAGVAKAYRIGANLVLTKPINVEQAKGTLRVARGLLRKNSDAADASATSAAGSVMPAKTAPISVGSSFQPASHSTEATAPPPSPPELPEFEAPLPTMVPAAIPALTASAKVEDKPATLAAEPAAEAWQPASPGAAKNEVAKIAASSLPTQNPSYALTVVPGSAAAPAPAKEVAAPPAKEKEYKSVESEPANPLYDAAPIPTHRSASVSDAPSFAALGEEDSSRSGGSKKFLIAAVAVLALAALGWKLGKFATDLAPQHVRAPQTLGQPAPAPAPMSSPVAAPSKSTPGRANAATQTLAPKTTTAAPLDKPSAGAGNSPVTRIALDPEPGTKKPDSAPIQVKSNAAGTKTKAQAEESAPQLPSPLAVASANDSNLSGLMSSASSSVPTPSLAVVRISQGVSQALLIKRVQPKYPPGALAVHAQGAVQIEATINKEGNVVNLKVLSGDPVLAQAALEAVRQWRYKPYYLDGDPVEIQTQITVNFKVN
ncbi:MAG: TonB family protein [Terriglobales bacterium]|jgi:protein TonB